MCWSCWPPVSPAAALQLFSEYCGRRNADVFLEITQCSGHLEHLSPSQQSCWLQPLWFYFSTMVQQCCDIKTVTPTMVLLLPPREPDRLWSQWLLPWENRSATQRGHAHVQLLGSETQGLRLQFWEKHIHIWLISKLLSLGSISSSQQGEKVVTFFTIS